MSRRFFSKASWRWGRDVVVSVCRLFFAPLLRTRFLHEGEARRSMHRRKRIGLVLVVCGAGAVAAAQFVLPPPYGERIATGHAEYRSSILKDGTVLRAGPNTLARIGFSEGVRRVYLERGDIFAEVAHQPSRPFEVITDVGTARAVGTQFGVTYLPSQEARITVTEGSVRVTAPLSRAGSAASRSELVLHAGEGTAITAGRIAERHRQVYMEEGTLVVEGVTIGALASQLTSQGVLRIVVDDPQLASVQIPGLVLDRFEPQQLVKRFEDSPNIKVEKRDGVVHLRARPGPCANWLNCSNTF